MLKKKKESECYPMGWGIYFDFEARLWHTQICVEERDLGRQCGGRPEGRGSWRLRHNSKSQGNTRRPWGRQELSCMDYWQDRENSVLITRLERTKFWKCTLLGPVGWEAIGGAIGPASHTHLRLREWELSTQGKLCGEQRHSDQNERSKTDISLCPVTRRHCCLL